MSTSFTGPRVIRRKPTGARASHTTTPWKSGLLADEGEVVAGTWQGPGSGPTRNPSCRPATRNFAKPHVPLEVWWNGHGGRLLRGALHVHGVPNQRGPPGKSLTSSAADTAYTAIRSTKQYPYKGGVAQIPADSVTTSTRARGLLGLSRKRAVRERERESQTRPA